MISSIEPLQPLPTSTFKRDVSASDAVFNSVVQGLETHRFVPGQRLVEVDLALRFGVSRSSVREAMQRLVADGIVEMIRYKGAVIKSLSVKETMDVLDVAERMTALLTKSAAFGIKSGESAHSIERALGELRTAGCDEDIEAFSAARRGFYRALLDVSGSRELKRLFPSIQMPVVYAQHKLPLLQKLRLRDYELIGRAVVDGDEDAADAAGMKHVKNVREEILLKIRTDT